MNVVDSSGWLAYFTNGPKAPVYAPAIEDTERLLVSTISLYEVYKKVLRERGEDTALFVTDVMRKGRLVKVNDEIALVGARLSVQHRLAMADSLILATARVHQATLWTQDADFQGLDKVNYVEPA